MSGKTRIVRSFVVDGKKLELMLNHGEKGSTFSWFENDKLASDQLMLFATYNPKLIKIVRILAQTGLRHLRRADLIGLLKHNRPNIYHYFLHIRPDLIGEKILIKKIPPRYGYRIPMWCVCEVLADFIPIIEKWERIEVVAKIMDLTPSAIKQRHKLRTIEAKKFLAKLWISPVGVQQLRPLIRSKVGSFDYGHDTYYHPVDIAREVVRRRGQVNEEDERLFERARNRYSILIRAHRESFGVIRPGNRDAVKQAVRDMLCDAVQKSEAAKMLGITISSLGGIINKDLLRCYQIGSRQWVSYQSCLDYKAKRDSRL